MKIHYTVWVAIILLVISGTSFAETPHQLGPFILGHDIAEFADFVQMDTSLPIRHMESIREVETRPIKGFKSGLIAYGTCAAQNRVVRIKLKYSDGSKSFYKKLKKRIDYRFGKSDEYRGDPFHIVIGWKWSFMDKDNNKISLILQHNARDEEEKIGNAIKLTMTSLLESDWECYKKKVPAEQAGGSASETQELELEQTGWDLFMPR
ncbi:MAG: hypothetical protein DRH90_05815 [Deltaproteobacteria bacterium]|nr:MAG: hypothetical protein DRH90_05815 [Deltaproteobacteria bacterium]